MKPRTKLQHEVVKLSSYLPKIREHQKQWAYQVCMDHKGYATKSRVICMDCGETFSPDLVHRKRATCPHCQTKLKIENTRKSTWSQCSYFAIAEIHDRFQVIRNFELYGHHKKGKKVRYMLHEILQYWVAPNGKTENIGRLHTCNSYCDFWGGDWSIRKDGVGYYYHQKYNVHPYKYHPDSKFKKEYKKYGIDHNLQGMNFLTAIKMLPVNPQAETLLKAKQYSLLAKFGERGITRYWPSIKICLRNKYKVKDAGMWTDYIDLLNYFHKDLRNAKYVCPRNLKKEHDRLVKKKRRIREKEERIQQKKQLELKKQKAQREQSDYIKDKAPFFGLCFQKDNLKIKVLESVQEFVEEGDELHHCVFASGYHKKQNSLILSARVRNKRIATIEICLDTMKIEQIRGRNNNTTDYDSEIRKLLRKNIDKIKDIVQSTSGRELQELVA